VQIDAEKQALTFALGERLKELSVLFRGEKSKSPDLRILLLAL
jgi:hypothetical protein